MADRRTAKSEQALAMPKYLGVLRHRELPGQRRRGTDELHPRRGRLPSQEGLRLQHRDHRRYLGQRTARRAPPASLRRGVGQRAQRVDAVTAGRGQQCPLLFSGSRTLQRDPTPADSTLRFTILERLVRQDHPAHSGSHVPVRRTPEPRTEVCDDLRRRPIRVEHRPHGLVRHPQKPHPHSVPVAIPCANGVFQFRDDAPFPLVPPRPALAAHDRQRDFRMLGDRRIVPEHGFRHVVDPDHVVEQRLVEPVEQAPVEDQILLAVVERAPRTVRPASSRRRPG